MDKRAHIDLGVAKSTHDEVQRFFASPHTLCVIIPTFRRLDGLRCAINSVINQTILKNFSINLIVCDNSPEASARLLISEFTELKNITLDYVHEPSPGVANARNTAVFHCHDDFIAFLDDDEEARPDWLSNLIATQQSLSADVVFGPVKARLSVDRGRFNPYLEFFFSRFGPDQDQILNSYYGCGNSLIRLSILPKDRLPFAVLRNNMGGEDDELFHMLLLNNHVFGWSSQALVYEDVPKHRANLHYSFKRAFAFGQGPSFSAYQSGHWLQLSRWMAIGLLQCIAMTLIGLPALAFGLKQGPFYLDKAVRGLGKLFWFEPFKIQFYGTSLLGNDEKKGSL